MKSNAVFVMGYPAKPNQYRFNSNRDLSTSSNSKKTRKNKNNI